MKYPLPFIRLAAVQVWRHRVRSLLTIAGVGIGMFLFATVETLQSALSVATTQTAEDAVLVVYRENRFCPSTSQLPEHYADTIRRMEGVEEVIPIKITVNNCGASLDVVAFRGVPPQRLERFNPDIRVVDGDLQQWMNRSDGALIGSHFAARRKLNVGDTFAAAGVQVQINGIISSPHAQDNNVAYVHLPFLQQVSRAGLGVVTQFNVRVTDPAQLDAVAQRIDDYFRSDSDPTVTRPEKAFFARTAQDMIEMVQFSRWLGIGAVAGVLGLVANALLLAARGRVKESAVLQTIGFTRGVIGGLMLLEGLILGLIGGVAGTAAAAIFLAWQRFTLGNEGLTIALAPSVGVTLSGIVVACAVALLASLWPALVAARGPVAEALGRG